MAEYDRWEYRVLTLGSALRGPKDEEFTAAINEWGEEGWELVSTSPVEGTNKVRVVAKRPLTASARRRRMVPE